MSTNIFQSDFNENIAVQKTRWMMSSILEVYAMVSSILVVYTFNLCLISGARKAGSNAK